MLAGIAAAAQGRPVAEVCDVYGVKTITTGIRPDGFTPELVGAAMHAPESTDSGEQAFAAVFRGTFTARIISTRQRADIQRRTMRASRSPLCTRMRRLRSQHPRRCPAMRLDRPTRQHMAATTVR